MIARELWAQGYAHLSTAAHLPTSAEFLAQLRNTLGPDALRAESFYVHPETGKTYGCATAVTQGKAEVWLIETQPVSA